MPFNGSGGTSQPVGGSFPAVPSTLIESAKVNISIADIYSMLGSVVVKDGQQVTTVRIPFAQGISTDTIAEKTSSTGVTIDGVLLQDGRIDTTQGADITCAATINLETATGNVVDVTGSTGPVTAVTLSQGHWRFVRFTGTPTLTHGASLVLPNAASYTVVAGDYILFIGYASSVVRAYIFPTSGPLLPYVDTNPVVVGSADATKKLRFEVDGLTTATTRVVTIPDANCAIPVVKRKTADESVTSSTVVQNDDHLLLAVAANEEWVADFFLDVGADLKTPGIRFSWSVPSGATVSGIINACGTPNAAFDSNQYAIRTTESTTVSIPASQLPQTTNAAITITVSIINGSTPGTVNLAWAQATSSGTATTIRQGSHMIAYRVA